MLQCSMNPMSPISTWAWSDRTCVKRKRRPDVGGALLRSYGQTTQVFIESKNSELFLVLRSLSRRKSIASMVPIGLRIRRSTYIFFNTVVNFILPRTDNHTEAVGPLGWRLPRSNWGRIDADAVRVKAANDLIFESPC